MAAPERSGSSCRTTRSAMCCGSAAHLSPSSAGTRVRADVAVASFAGDRRCWQVCSVAGSKGERAYAWHGSPRPVPDISC